MLRRDLVLTPTTQKNVKLATTEPTGIKDMNELPKVLGLFTVTAVAEILGCYLPLLWLQHRAGAWVLLPAIASLALFVWLLTLHPYAAGRVYAAYGGVYVAVAVLWLWLVDGVLPDRWDVFGSLIALTGMAVIMFAPRSVQ